MIEINLIFLKVFLVAIVIHLNKPAFCSTELFNLAPLLLLFILFGIVYIVYPLLSSNHASLLVKWPMIGGLR